MDRLRLVRLAAGLTMVPLLSGCIAAALAVPAMTAVGMLTEKKRTRAEIVADLPAANAAALAALPEPGREMSPSVQLTTLTELPPPSGASATTGGPWQDFARFTLERASGLATGGEGRSALLTPESVATFRTQTRPCRSPEPAVAIDLDPPEGTFSPAATLAASAETVSTLAQLRQAGVIVLWVSQASANEVAGIAAALQASGLDPTGRDPILLVRNADERKQVLREEANETVCLVAIAGDERSDFDELFDYLRDPELATAWDGKLGAGWFLMPPLVERTSPVPPTGEDGGG